MKCLLLGTFSFPTGMPSSARIKNLAYGFRKAGYEVDIYALFPGAADEAHGSENKLDNGISYTYAVPQMDATIWANPSKRPLYLAKLQKQATQKLKHLVNENKYSFAMLYGRGLYGFYSTFSLLKRHGIPIIYDVVELPAVYNNVLDLMMHPLRLDSVLGEYLFSRKSAIITCITTALQKRFPKQRTYLLPGIEEWKENPPAFKTTDVFTFMYTGIFIEKDNPELMFRLFQELDKLNKDFIIKIAGRYEHYKDADAWITRYKETFPGRLLLLGELTDEKLTENIEDSDALLLLRQDNLSEENTFPTRLVEYLKTGKLVITSPKGDLNIYLQHLQNSFLVPYHLPESTVQELKQLMQENIRIKKIGESGFYSGQHYFNRAIHTAQLAKLIAKIK